MKHYSPSGLDIIPSLEWGSHFTQFYGTAEDLRDILVPYFRAGLENNETCLWVTSAPFGPEDARSALRAAVPDLEARETRGQIEIHDGSKWYASGEKLKPKDLVADLLQRERVALDRGYRGLRTNGNCSWVQRDQWDDFQEYEALVHKTVSGRRMICSCSYCASDGKDLMSVMDHHDFVLPRSARGILLHETAPHDAEADASARYDTLVREMHHRVANTLATVQAIMGVSMRNAQTMADFRESFSDRIRSLAKTHNTLMRSAQQKIALRELLDNELGMYASGEANVTLGGPDVMLSDRIAVPVGMAIHELATNAAKYGALSVPEGRLSVEWRRVAEGVEINWRESNVVLLGTPTRRGFGSQLLKDTLPRQIGAEIDIRYELTGVEARMVIPVQG